jgi:hypothetical protein
MSDPQEIKIRATSKFAATMHKLHLSGIFTEKEREMVFAAMAVMEVHLDDNDKELIEFIAARGISVEDVKAFTNSDKPTQFKQY